MLAIVLTIVGAWMVLGVALTPLPGKTPIGYSQRDAALGIQVMALSFLILVKDRKGPWSWGAVIMAIAAVLANDARAGTGLAVAVAAAGVLGLIMPRAHRRWLAVLAAVASMAAAVVGVAAIARRVHWSAAIDDAVHPVRRALWNTAWRDSAPAEILGQGPGSFAASNPLARDPDTMSAHSSVLQTLTELGLTGLVLLGAMVLLAVVAAHRAASANSAWVALAAISALVIHAAIDHLLEYGPLPLAVGVVVGYALGVSAKSEGCAAR